MAKVTLVTVSEFGRRVAENGSRGVDHGHGNAMLLLGGGVRGGKVYGTWPGLAPAALVAGDLAATTDYRAVIGEILQKRCGFGALDEVFPGVAPSSFGLAAAALTGTDFVGSAGGAGAALGPDVEGDGGQQDDALDQHDRSVWAPISDMPLLITAMIRPPMIAPTTLPTPPCTAAPPMKAAAMASSSNMLPAVGLAWLSRPAKMMPASAASTPMLTKIQKFTDLTLTPDSVAAGRLPPIA